MADDALTFLTALGLTRMTGAPAILERCGIRRHSEPDGRAGRGIGGDAVDSAGAMVPEHAGARVAALREALAVDIGFHAHNNLGASAGNAQTEVLAAGFERAGWDTGVDLFGLIDTAEHLLAPLMNRTADHRRDRAGPRLRGRVLDVFHPTKRAAKKYGVATREIVVELGRRGVIGGQEDMIIDVCGGAGRSQRAGGSRPMTAAITVHT